MISPDIIVPTCRTQSEIHPMICDMLPTIPGCHWTATCLDASASVNRNAGLNNASTEIVIQCDDDIRGFYYGWVSQLLEPFVKPDVMMVSARLMRRDATFGEMHGSKYKTDGKYEQVDHCPSACIAMRLTDLRYDERFIKSGWEDTEYLHRLRRRFPQGQILIHNQCRLVHLNEAKGQGDAHEYNQALYNKLTKTGEYKLR